MNMSFSASNKTAVLAASALIAFGFFPVRAADASADEGSETAETGVSDTPPSEQGHLCSDGVDNDRDGKVDCLDDSCANVPWCPGEGEVGQLCADGQDNDKDGFVDCEEPSCKLSRYCEAGPEMGLQCRDEKDNNNNGLVDCWEPSCQDTEYCVEKIFYEPEPRDKPVGLLLSLGVGLAFPNWRPPESDLQQDAQGNRYVVPYLPDIGPLADLSLEYLFLPWIGFGIKGMVAGTSVQSLDEWYEDDYYKFDGLKVYFHMGGFFRFQYPFERAVPFLDIAAGYSYIQYRWAPITRFEESGNTSMTLDKIMEPPSHHVTFALEPGLDFYIIKRMIAVGVKAWLPFAATGGSSMDNTGAMLTATYTPFWPEEPAVKPEYLKPAPANQ